MEKDTKLFFGRILGEIYRIQKHNEMPCAASETEIYGLLRGFEDVIDEQLDLIGYVPSSDVENVGKVLEEIYSDEEKLKSFKGFYDIEHKLNSMDINRPQAIKIITYFNIDEGFDKVIKKNGFKWFSDRSKDF